MLVSHISFTLGLIALVAGVCLYLWSVRAEPGSGIGLARVVGILVIILSILSLIATVYSGIRMHSAFHDLYKDRHQTTPNSRAVTQAEPSNDSTVNAGTANAPAVNANNTTSMNVNPPVSANTPENNNGNNSATIEHKQ